MAKLLQSITGRLKSGTKVARPKQDPDNKPDEETETQEEEVEGETETEEEETGDGAEEESEEEEDGADDDGEAEDEAEDAVTLTRAELDAMVDRRIAEKTKQDKEKERRDRRRQDAEKAKNDGDFKKLYEEEIDAHEDTQEQLETLQREVQVERTRNQALAYALKNHAEIAGDVDDWVMPRIERRLREGLEDTEVRRLIKQEVTAYSKQYEKKRRNSQQRSGGTPSGGSRGKLDELTTKRLQTMTPRAPSRDEEEDDVNLARSGF